MINSVLITGGTGTFGQAATRALLARDTVERVVVYSRDELKQQEMRAAIPDERVRWFIGDVRDLHRLERAFAGVDTVIHAAAMKQVPACEYNPHEAVKTNIYGTQNVIDASLNTHVERVFMIGTDKAVDPVTLYGATKLAAEKLIVDANNYSGKTGTRFAACRYGNVVNSRGSVIPFFQMLAEEGLPLPVTDPSATRFLLTIDQAVWFVLDRIGEMTGGEVFVPNLPAATVEQIALAAAGKLPGVQLHVTGLRAGEKQHELLISRNESGRADEHDGYWTLQPTNTPSRRSRGVEVSSETARRLTIEEIRALAGLKAAA